jgi:hypothetical protein
MFDLDILKSFTPQRLETEELVSLSAYARILAEEYLSIKQDPPEWLENQFRAIRRELKTRNADALQNKLRAAKARRETLLTTDEKRAKIDAEIV